MEMAGIVDATFVRLGTSGEEQFAEVEVRLADREQPLIATFKQEPDGSLSLVNVVENKEQFDIDWFDNSLHTAHQDASNRWLTNEFGQAVLHFGDIKATIGDKFYYGE